MIGKTFYGALVVWLGLAGVVQAADCVCEDATTPGVFVRYVPSQNKCQDTAVSGETCHSVQKGADTTSQRAINLGDPHATPPVPPSVPEKYRKVANKLVVEMTATEKQQVDAAEAAEAAIKQQYVTEVTTQEMCQTKLLSQITQFLDNREANKVAGLATSQAALQADIDAFQGEIDAMTQVNLAVAKDMFTKANVLATKSNVRTHDLLRASLNDSYILFDNVARCLRSAIEVTKEVPK